MARFMVQLGDELGARVDKMAKKRYISLAAMVRTALVEWLRENEHSTRRPRRDGEAFEL